MTSTELPALVNSDPAVAANLAAPYRLTGDLHPAYTESVGDGWYDIGIYLPVRHLGLGRATVSQILRDREMVGLAALTGADYAVDMAEGVASWHITTKGSATDFEESRSSYSVHDVGLVTQTSAHYGVATYLGVLLDSRTWPLGTDPARQGDSDTDPDQCTTCSEPHPFAAYLPPQSSRVFTDTPLVIVKVAPHGRLTRRNA